ncbi:Resistance to inhibitors of cholinesterase protein 3 N-terminal [Trinorchestia longiramus]|nr:Resistance to inhibitors of cholinesterase protein 3 N-terminal [Trinorchestia longiramus]
MSGEFGTGKTIFVLAIVVGCFAVLWPKVFYPMLTASSISTTTKTSVPKTESSGPRAERPAHLHPDMLHPALRERGRALPVRTIDKEAKRQKIRAFYDTIEAAKREYGNFDKPMKEENQQLHLPQDTCSWEPSDCSGDGFSQTSLHPPGPMPGVRPPMGGGAGHVAPSTNTKASSSMSIIMPLYTVGIIIFFIYTIMKVLFKKCPDDDDKTPKLKNFHMDPEYRKYIFEEEYLDSGDTGKDAFVKRAEPRETLGLRRRHVQDQPERKIEDEQMDQLRRRLEDTERAMERLMAQMGTVSDKLTAAKITEVLSQAQTQAKLLKVSICPMRAALMAAAVNCIASYSSCESYYHADYVSEEGICGKNKRKEVHINDWQNQACETNCEMYDEILPLRSVVPITWPGSSHCTGQKSSLQESLESGVQELDFGVKTKDFNFHDRPYHTPQDVDNGDSNEKCAKATPFYGDNCSSNIHSQSDAQCEPSSISAKSVHMKANCLKTDVPLKLRKSYVCETADMKMATQNIPAKSLTEISPTGPFDSLLSQSTPQKLETTKVTSVDILNNFALESKGDPYLFLQKSNGTSFDNTQNDVTEPPRKKISALHHPYEATVQAQLESESLTKRQQMFGEFEENSSQFEIQSGEMLPFTKQNDELQDTRLFSKCDETSSETALSNTSLDLKGSGESFNFQMEDESLALTNNTHSIENETFPVLSQLNSSEKTLEPGKSSEVLLSVSEQICLRSGELDLIISQPPAENIENESNFTVSNSDEAMDTIRSAISQLCLDTPDTKNQVSGLQCQDTKPPIPDESGLGCAEHFDEEDGDELRSDTSNVTNFEWKTPSLASEVISKEEQSSETNVLYSENLQHFSRTDSCGNVDSSLDTDHTLPNIISTSKRNKSQIPTNKQTISPKMPPAQCNSEPIATIPSSARRRRGGRKKRQRLRRSNRLPQEDTTSEDEDLLSSEDLTATFTDDESLLSTALRHKLIEQILIERHPSIQYQLDDTVEKGIHRRIESESQNKHECFPQTTALPTTPTTGRCDVKVSSEKEETTERTGQFSPVIEDKVSIEENETSAEVKGGELINSIQLVKEKQTIENNQTPVHGMDNSTQGEISEGKQERLQVKNIAVHDEKLAHTLTVPKTEDTPGSDLGRVINKSIMGIRANLSPSPPSSLPAQKVSFHPKDSIIDGEADGSDDDRSSDATETGADVSELRSFAEDVDASKLANEIISSPILSKGIRELNPEAVMPKFNDASHQRWTPMLENDQKSNILEIKKPKFYDTPEVVMPKFDNTPEVVMPKFDDTPEVVMPKFDDTTEVVMPKFDDTPEVVMPKFDDTPEVVMPKFDDTPEVVMPKFDDTPEVVLPKFYNTPEVVMPKFDDTLEVVMPKFDDTPEVVMPKFDDTPEVVMPKFDDTPEVVLPKFYDTPEVVMPKFDDTPEVVMPKFDDTPEIVMPKFDDIPEVVMPKFDDTPEVVMNKFDDTPEVVMPKMDDTPEVVMPKFDDTPEVVMPKFDDTPEVVMPKFDNSPEVAMPKFDGIPEVVVPKFDDTPEVVVSKFDVTPEVMMPKFDDTPEVVVPKFDDTPEIVMPKFDDIPEVVVPKSDDTPEVVVPKFNDTLEVMPKFNDTHEDTNPTLGGTPQVIKTKIIEALQSKMQKIDEASTVVDKSQVSDAPTFLRMVDDTSEFLLPKVGDSPELVIPEVDAGTQLVILKDENVSDLAMLTVNDVSALVKSNTYDPLPQVTPKLNDGPTLEAPKVDDGPVLLTKTDVFTPNVATFAEVMTPKGDYVTEVSMLNDHVLQVMMEKTNTTDATMQVVDVQDNSIPSNIKTAVPNNHDVPKMGMSEIYDVPDTVLVKRDGSEALILNVNNGSDTHENAFEIGIPKSGAPQSFEPEVPGYSTFKNEVLQIPSAAETPKNWDVEEVAPSMSSGTPKIECYSNEKTKEDLKNNQIHARGSFGTTPSDINISLSSTVHIIPEVIKSDNKLVETALNLNSINGKSMSNKEKTTENLISKSRDSEESSQRENHEVVNVPNKKDNFKTFECTVSNQAKPDAHWQKTLADNFSFTDRDVHSRNENNETPMVLKSMVTTDNRTTNSKMQEPLEMFTIVSDTGTSVTEDDIRDDRENSPIQESYELDDNECYVLVNNECDERIPPNREHGTDCLKSPSVAVCSSVFVPTEDIDESENSSHLRQMNSRNNPSLQHQPENQLHEATCSALSTDVASTLQEIEHTVRPLHYYEPKDTVIKMALQPLESDDELTDSEGSEEKYAAVGTQTSLALDPPRMLRKKTAETSTQVEEGALSVLGFSTSWCVNVCEIPDTLPNIRDVTLDALLPSETQALVFQNKVGRTVSPNVEEDVSEIESSPYVITSQLSLNIIGLEHTNDSQNSKPAILFQAANPTHSTAHNSDDLIQSPPNSLNTVMNLPNKTSFYHPQLMNTEEHTDVDINSPPAKEIFIQSLTTGENLGNGRNKIVNVLNQHEIPRPKTPTLVGIEELALTTENQFETFKHVLPTSVNEVTPDTENSVFEENTTPLSWPSNVLPYENSMFLASSSTEDTEVPMYFSCSVVHTPCSSIPQTPDQEAEIILASNADRTTYVVDEAASSLPDASDSFVLGATTPMLVRDITRPRPPPAKALVLIFKNTKSSRKMTRQQPPQTEGKQPHSNDAHFHPEEESIRESPTVEAILSGDEKDESSLQLLPKPGDDSPSSGGTEAVIQSSSRIENLTSS